jgi:hypothetical protein
MQRLRRIAADQGWVPAGESSLLQLLAFVQWIGST